MDWRLKCAALHVLNFLPYRVHASLQRRITGRYLLDITDQVLSAYSYHVANFRKVGGRALEFGAGSNLLSALLLSNAGATEVLAYDLSRIATTEQVNWVVRQLRGRVHGDWPEINDLGDSLLSLYRIRYLAPADAAKTGLAAGLVDFFCSTSTLEHIPAMDIRRILSECQRIASPKAIFSFIIDYHDHYHTADPAITRINFYRYSDFLWRFLNPSNHHQNRLRHSDFEDIFLSCALVPSESRATVTDVSIEVDHIAPRFRHYSQKDLMALNGFFTLHPR